MHTHNKHTHTYYSTLPRVRKLLFAYFQCLEEQVDSLSCFQTKKIKHNINHFTVFSVHLGFFSKKIGKYVLYTWPVRPVLNVRVHILFSFTFLLKNFIRGYSTSPTARTDDKGFQPKGELLQWYQSKSEK